LLFVVAAAWLYLSNPANVYWLKYETMMVVDKLIMRLFQSNYFAQIWTLDFASHAWFDVLGFFSSAREYIAELEFILLF
jgi:hypothetical protein